MNQREIKKYILTGVLFYLGFYLLLFMVSGITNSYEIASDAGLWLIWPAILLTGRGLVLLNMFINLLIWIVFFVCWGYVWNKIVSLVKLSK